LLQPYLGVDGIPVLPLRNRVPRGRINELVTIEDQSAGRSESGG